MNGWCLAQMPVVSDGKFKDLNIEKYQKFATILYGSICYCDIYF